MVFKRDALELFLISLLALFLELVIIRWLSTEVRIFAYFKNLPLMAAFLGFGVGCFYYDKSEQLFYRWFPRLIAFLVAIIALAPKLDITHVIFVDPRQYFLLGVGFGDHARQSLPSLLQSAKAIGVIVGLFFLVAAAFAVLATRIGELLDGFRERPLRGYSLNIAGSLAGVLLFSLLAFVESPPPVWLLVSLPPLL